MNLNLSQANRSLWVWGAGNGGDQQPRVQRAEIEATVEAIGEGGEVSSRILSEVERMVTATEAGFEVAEHGVDPHTRLYAERAFRVCSAKAR